MAKEMQELENDKRMLDIEWEKNVYSECERRGYFEPDCHDRYNPHYKDSKPFCIMMPPPNVTGVLHIGHALTFTLQDIITRYKRMDGFRVLWQPGLDHAGIAPPLSSFHSHTFFIKASLPISSFFIPSASNFFSTTF